MSIRFTEPGGRNSMWLAKQTGFLKVTGPISEKAATQIRRTLTNAKRRIQRKSACK